MNYGYKYFEKYGGVFNCLIENYDFDLGNNFRSLMILLEKHYHFFDVRPFESKSFINFKRLNIGQEFKEYYDIRFKTYRNEDGQMYYDYIHKNENLSITYNFDSNSNHKFTSLTFCTHPVVNFFKYIELDENGEEQIIVEDQVKAATLNRKIMTEFLNDLDQNYGSIIEYGGESGAIDPMFWYKYGVKEDAVQNNF